MRTAAMLVFPAGAAGAGCVAEDDRRGRVAGFAEPPQHYGIGLQHGRPMLLLGADDAWLILDGPEFPGLQDIQSGLDIHGIEPAELAILPAAHGQGVIE